jgi:prepilin signal peptidase PulO-like enzyme (type II secretory pathway)
MELDLASILTVPGAAAAAAVVTTVIQLVKTAVPALDAGWEKAGALVLSGVLVVLALVDGGVYTLPALFVGFLAWLGIAKLATGIYDEFAAQPGSFRGDGVTGSGDGV